MVNIQMLLFDQVCSLFWLYKMMLVFILDCIDIYIVISNVLFLILLCCFCFNRFLLFLNGWAWTGFHFDLLVFHLFMGRFWFLFTDLNFLWSRRNLEMHLRIDIFLLNFLSLIDSFSLNLDLIFLLFLFVMYNRSFDRMMNIFDYIKQIIPSCGFIWCF